MKKDTDRIDSTQIERENASRPGIFARLRSNFLTGTIFIAPIAITGYFIWWAVNYIDRLVRPFIPDRYEPNINGWEIPGIGLIAFLIAATLTGWLLRGFIGRQLVKLVASIMNQFPVIRPIYNALKQILETVFSSSSQSFQQACLVEYPRKGIYAIGFISTTAKHEVRTKIGKELVAVFVPTTPNPTSGFLLYFDKKEIIYLDMSPEEAAKLVISAGMVEPDHLPVKPAGKA